MLIGIIGGIGCGKSSLARHLAEAHGFEEVYFATKLKDAALDIFGLEHRHVYGTQAEKMEPLDGLSGQPLVVGPTGNPQTGRSICEHFGTEGCRAIDPEVWIKALMREVDGKAQRMRSRGREARFVIGDLRFPNEAQAVWQRSGQIWRVDVVGEEPMRTGHESDEAWRRIEPDVALAATRGDLPGLFALADEALADLAAA